MLLKPCLQLAIVRIAGLLLLTGAAHAQQTVSSAVQAIQTTTASSTTCPLPGSVFKNAKDQISGKNAVPLSSQQVLNKLIQTLRLDNDSSEPVTFYDGFVTRLFDTPSSNDVFGSLPNSELLGISTADLDPNALIQWGTNTSTLKLDCNSLLNIALQASGGLGNLFPLATLNGAFTGSLGTTASTTVNIITGNAQSPFAEYYYQKTGDYKQLFAILRAIAWQESDLAKVSKRINYIKKAKFISYALNVDQTAKNSVAASISAGVSIPLYFSTKDSLSYQLTNDYQLKVSHFTTYYYESEPGAIPPLTELIGNATQDIPAFTLSSQSILPGDSVTALGKVQGWPPDLCKSTKMWDISLSNASSYKVSTVSIAPGDDTADKFPTCNISLTAKSESTIPPNTSAPQFVMTLHTDPAVTFPISTAAPPAGQFTVLQSPSFNPNGGGLMMYPVQNAPASGPATTQVLWKVNGIVQIPSTGFTIDHYGLDAAPLSCAIKDGATTELQATLPSTFDAPPSFFASSNLTLPFSSLNVTIIAGLTLGGSIDYNVAAPKTSLKTCTLSGTLHIFLKDAAGVIADKAAAFSVPGVAFPPVRGLPTITSLDCGGTGPVAGALNLAELSAGGLSCNISGSDLDIRTSIQFESGGTSVITAKLVPGKDSAHAAISIPASDLKKLTSTSPYSLWLSDDSGNSNNSQSILSVVPFPSATLSSATTLAQFKAANPATLQLTGTSLKQVKQVLLVDHTTQLHVATTPTTITDDTAIQAPFPQGTTGKLTGGAYDVLLVIDPTANVTFDPHIELQ